MLESTQSIRMTAEQKEAEISKLMAAVDTNGDGVVDFDEFKEWFIPTARTIQEHKRRAEQIKRQRRAQKAGQVYLKQLRENTTIAVAVNGTETSQIT